MYPTWNRHQGDNWRRCALLHCPEYCRLGGELSTWRFSSDGEGVEFTSTIILEFTGYTHIHSSQITNHKPQLALVDWNWHTFRHGGHSRVNPNSKEYPYLKDLGFWLGTGHWSWDSWELWMGSWTVKWYYGNDKWDWEKERKVEVFREREIRTRFSTTMEVEVVRGETREIGAAARRCPN